MSKGISVNNFDEVRLALRKELKLLSTKFQSSLSAVKLDEVANTTDILKLEKVIECLEMMTKLYDSFARNMELNTTINVAPPEIILPEINLPDINIPEIRIPTINVPESRITVNTEFEVDEIIRALEPLKALSRNPNKPISVRLSDGKKFIDVLTKASDDLSNASSKLGMVFSGGNSGMTSDEYKTVGGRLGTDYIFNGNAKLTPIFSTISASSSGNNTIVSAVTEKKIRVLQMDLVSNGTVNVKFQSGAGGTDITGLSYLIANTGIVRPFSPYGWFETASSSLLNLNLSGAVAVGGSLLYIEV